MSHASLLVVTIVIVACLTAAATAVRSVSRIWLRHWVERRLSGAQTAALYLERPQQLILAATTGVAMAVFLAGTFIGTAIPGGFVPRARAIVFYALALLLLGQLVPRAVARRWSSLIIPVLLPLLQLVELLFMPLLWLVRRVTGEARRDAAEDNASEGELLGELLREGELEGVGEHAEIAIIEGVVQFGAKTLGQVMTPRREVFAIAEATPPAEVARLVAQSGYTRVPIYRESLDQVIGMLHAFDLLQMEGHELPKLRPVMFAGADLPCDDFLFRMIRGRSHQAIVRDAAGQMVGIVTLEDLLEELVGEIRDEHDEPAPESASASPPGSVPATDPAPVPATPPASPPETAIAARPAAPLGAPLASPPAARMAPNAERRPDAAR